MTVCHLTVNPFRIVTRDLSSCHRSLACCRAGRRVDMSAKSKKCPGSDDVDDGVGGHKDTREDGKGMCAAMGCANAGTKICGGCMQVC